MQQAVKLASMSSKILYNPYVSVDCVVFGFDGEKIKVLLIERHIEEKQELYNDKKLPGSIIYKDENLDDAANRILYELTGLKDIYLSQFQSFGDPDRIKDPRDVLWLENTMRLKIERIVTVGYMALIKINRKIKFASESAEANWYDLEDIQGIKLAFDHAEIIQKAIEHIRYKLSREPYLFFELLPRKFSMSQFRTLYDTVHQVKSDVRNFQKKVNKLPYIIPLEEFEKNVPHRAARLYKFDKSKVW